MAADLRFLWRVLVLVLRYVTGMPLDGKRRTDATFFRRGSMVTDPHWFGAGIAWWSMLPGCQRAAVRVAPIAGAVGWWKARTVTEWAAAVVLGPLFGLLVARAVRGVILGRHRRTLIRPLAAALSPYLGVPPESVASALNLRRDHVDAGSDEHIGSLTLPDHWAATADQRKLVEDVIGARFGVELRYRWHTAAYPMLLNLTRAPIPPAVVPFAAWREAIAGYPAHRIMLGLDSAGKPRDWDTSAEDPHLAIHGGSRRGKTSLLLSIAAQELFKGAELVACVDPKRVSLTPLAGIPGVRLYNDARNVQSMWDGIAAFRQLVEDRYDALAADPTLEFRRALLIIDEVSQFSGMSRMYWRRIRATSDPQQPPVWDDVAAAVWMGAQARAHVVVAGQRLDHAILGGMLGSFGVRLLAGYTAQDYARLVGLTPFQRSQKPRGRFLLYEGGELTWLQLLKTDDPDRDYTGLRDFALAGALRHGGGRFPASDLAADTSPVSLRDAVAAGVLTISVDAAKRARADDPRFPAAVAEDGQTMLYRPADLRDWQASRPRAGVGGAS